MGVMKLQIDVVRDGYFLGKPSDADYQAAHEGDALLFWRTVR
jgi:hypothetical protein